MDTKDIPGISLSNQFNNTLFIQRQKADNLYSI